MRILLLTVMVLGFIGCTKPNGGLSIAFEELGSEVNSKYGSEGLRYRSSINISGLGQNQVIGEILTVPGENLPDTYAIPIFTGCSKVAVSIYDNNRSIEDVIRVKNALNTLIQKESLSVVLKTEIYFIELLEKRLSEKGEKKTLKIEIKKRYPVHNEAYREALEDQLSLLHSKLDKLNKEILEQRATMDNIPVGIMIAHWSSKKTKKSRGFISSLFNSQSHKELNREGFVVLAGLKTESIWLGDDFAWYTMNDKDGSDAILDNNGYIVTYKLSAQHRAYSETLDYQSLLNTKLSLSTKEIKGILGKTYAKLFHDRQMELQFSLSNMISSTNTGTLTAPTKDLFEYRFKEDDEYAKSVKYNYKRTSGYSEVYSVRSNIADIKKSLTDKTKTKLQRLECRDEKAAISKSSHDNTNIFNQNLLDQLD